MCKQVVFNFHFYLHEFLFLFFKMNNSDINNFKFVRDVMPKYDGNPKILNYYIREVENILLMLDEPARVSPPLISLIKSRLSGTAIDAVAYEESLNTWDSIKAALIRRLGEPRNEIQVMQELTRVRRNKNEDAEAFGKRLRDILDTLNSVGRHSDKSYYENMVIDQYINNLEFHVSIGVRISRPMTLEVAIITARQEEARLAHNKFNNFHTPPIQAKPKEMPRPNMQISQTSPPFRFSNIPKNRFFDNVGPQQRPQWVHPTSPWKNKQTTGNVTPQSSGNFRNSGNFRQQQNMLHQQVNQSQNSSDVTMRSVNKPPTPQLGQGEFYYTSNEPDFDQDGDNPYCEQGEYFTTQYFDQDYAGTSADQPNNQDFPEDKEKEDHS